MRARCAVCLHTMPLRGEGTIHVHGPVGHRCVGSGKPPSSVGLNIAAACHSLWHGPAPALRSKHPAAHPDTSLPSAPKEEALEAALVVSEREVSQAIRSFPRGSAGGPDGLRPQHLVDMTSMSAGGGGEGGELLLRALNTFTNFVLIGKSMWRYVHFSLGPRLQPSRRKMLVCGLSQSVAPYVGCWLRPPAWL